MADERTPAQIKADKIAEELAVDIRKLTEESFKKSVWDKKSAEQQQKAVDKMTKQYKQSGSDNFKQFDKFREDFADSGARTITEFKEMRKLEEGAAKDRKQRANQETRDAFLLRKSLIDKGIKDEDFLAKAESDRRDGLSITADQYTVEHADWQAANKKDKRDQADKRKGEKAEENRHATNMRSEQTLGKVLGTLMFSQKLGERAAKKAMQMKESVHKWWEDKKEKIAAGAKSILSWLLKAAGIGLLWLLFKYLAGLDWKKLWEDAQGWGEVMESFWSGIVSMGAWVGALKFGPWVKGLFGPNGSLFNFGQKM